MGIKGLMKLLSEQAPDCYKTTEVKNYMGRVVAIDASMQLYQFMIMVRSAQGGGPAQQLTNDAGEITSHLQGFFTRTIRLMEKGLKPVYVFDGKPPDLKLAELAKRKAMKARATSDLKSANMALKEGVENALELVNKAQKRTVSILKYCAILKHSKVTVTKEHNEDVQKLLRLMGIPLIIAPCEAEAQCAELCKKGKVWATATEDMDALTFGTPILLRHLTYAESRKLDVYEIHYEKVLKELDLTPRQFVDLCILCGCDYTESIKGIGPKTALRLIKEHKSIESIVKTIDQKKYLIPSSLIENVDTIRSMFEEAEVADANSFEKFRWEKPNNEEVMKYLVHEKQFDIERVSNALKRLEKSRDKTSQSRMDSFFKPVTSSKNVLKRKNEQNKSKAKIQKKGRS